MARRRWSIDVSPVLISEDVSRRRAIRSFSSAVACSKRLDLFHIGADKLYPMGLSLWSDNRILQQFASKCFTTPGRARELKRILWVPVLTSRFRSLGTWGARSGRNRENRSPQNRRERKSEWVEVLRVDERPFLANAGALPTMVWGLSLPPSFQPSSGKQHWRPRLMMGHRGRLSPGCCSQPHTALGWQ